MEESMGRECDRGVAWRRVWAESATGAWHGGEYGQRVRQGRGMEESVGRECDRGVAWRRVWAESATGAWHGGECGQRVRQGVARSEQGAGCGRERVLWRVSRDQ